MYAVHFLKTLRDFIGNDIVYYKILKKYNSADVRRPFSVINPDRLFMGKNVLIQSNCHFHCGGRPWCLGKGSIKIGDNCWFSENNILYGAGEIEIGNSSGTGPGVMIFSSMDDYSMKYAKLDHIVHRFKKVSIGSFVRIFSGVIIAPGVTIGEGAVIGAGSVVINDIPPWSLAAGVPAKVIKPR